MSMTYANANKSIKHQQAINHGQAIKLIHQHVESVVVKNETIPIDTALGRVNAAEILAPINVPAFACSSMDGYAINISQLQASQRSSSISTNSQAYSLELGAAIHAKHQANLATCGELAIPIMTGGLVPNDADGIVLKEHGLLNNNRLEFDQLPLKGKYIRTPGSDMREGQTILEASQILCAASLGLLSSVGIDEIEVKLKPSVALMMTGDELVQPGKPCLPGQVYDANAAMLCHLLKGMGCHVTLLDPLEDSEFAVNDRLNDLAQGAFDLVISVGGVSMGDKDWIPKAIEQQGSVIFHKLQIKPGFPMLFGQLGEALFYGLPGNPVSSYTTMCQYIYPAIQCMTQQIPQVTSWQAELTHGLKKSHLRREFMRGMFTVDHAGNLHVSVCGGQQSSRIESLVQANCFIVLDESQHDLSAGSGVPIQPFTDFKKCQ